MLPEYEQAKMLFLQYDLDVSRETYQKMECYASFLLDYNEKVNLTALTDADDILKKHFLDSMLLYGKCSFCFPERGKVLDIGSGAGFPGVPLGLQRDDLQITLLDSLQKRIVFLKLLCEKLGCRYEAVHGRAEELGKAEAYRESFDVVTARAVAAMPMLAEYALPFVKPGGYWLAMKGHEEFAPAAHAVTMLGGTLEQTISYALPDGDKRVIYVVKKTGICPTKYPRNSGQIKQKPL